jgi:hypothetical protein
LVLFSGGFGFVGAAYDSEELLAVTVELHLSDTSHVRERRE